MAKTIGNEQGPLTRARRAQGRGASALNDQTTEESRDEDMELPADEESVEEEAPARDAASGGSLVHHRPATVSRRVHIPEPLMGNPITRFMAESYLELRKVTWPTWNEAWNMTLVVIIVSAVIAAVLGLADLGLVRALSWLVGH